MRFNKQRPVLKFHIAFQPHGFAMQSLLSINVNELIHRKAVESVRVEFHERWNQEVAGGQILRTICAFANDFQNLNGGYVVVGVSETDGKAAVPANGLSSADMEHAQRWIQEQCKAAFSGYVPVLSPERIGDRDVLAVWAPASEGRPHQAPDENHDQKYWVRIGSETVDAEANGLVNSLFVVSTLMPWDNQVARDARVQDLREAMVREHLHSVGSKLRDDPDAIAVYRGMRITAPANGRESPRNVGLLFFSDDPEQWFPSARIVVVQFPGDRAGDVLLEHEFAGPIAVQLRNCLRYLEGLCRNHIKREVDQIQASRWVSYPILALREALVNAVYHRGYRQDFLEPTKVCIYPDRIEIISYPGPVHGVEQEHLLPNPVTPPSLASARNPRIGEFLKQLGLAEQRRTGLPKIYKSMAENGSPVPKFDFDEYRRWFRATLPAHPRYAAASALQDAAYLRAVGSPTDAYDRVHNAWKANNGSSALAEELIRLCAERGDLKTAEAVFDRFRQSGCETDLNRVAGRWLRVLSEA